MELSKKCYIQTQIYIQPQSNTLKTPVVPTGVLKIGELQTQYTPPSENLGIKVRGVLETSVHS